MGMHNREGRFSSKSVEFGKLPIKLPAGHGKNGVYQRVFAANDDSAFGCIKAFREAEHSVPEDINPSVKPAAQNILFLQRWD